ncbi:MAG: hypothetical protein IJ560_01600 [Alphaproteobacteria bacterium]|nr:hypothetical protein [Alphaproteobacteria bacterium]
MNNTRISAVFIGVLLGVHGGAGAVYPVNPAYNANVANAVNPVVVVPGNSVNVAAANPNSQVVYLPTPSNGVVVANSTVAAQPGRITGALPRVGSAATTAGRQYYQPADYERLADSGLYIGLSAAYAASIMGDMSQGYGGEEGGTYVPGSFAPSGYNSDTVIPLQVSVGAAINNDIRIDFSYLRYSGLSYASDVLTADDTGAATVKASVDGGAITSNTVMLNLYYNIDSYTGYIAGGSLRPYVGVGAGLALNTIADYVVLDKNFYSVALPQETEAGKLTGISDVYAYHNGGTEKNLAFMVEGGVSTDLGSGLRADFFVRYANMGKVKTSGSIVVSQTEWLSDGSGYSDGEYEAPYDSVFHYTNWYESGRLSSVDVGVRLRLQF